MAVRSAWSDGAYAALRAVSGFLFLLHGVQKLFGQFGLPRVPLASQYGAAGVIEITCGVLILAGILTSVAAFIASGEMAVAYFLGHAPGGGLPIQNGGEPAVLFCFIFLYVATRGGGRWSLGPWLGSRF